jgi:hypothetical protein
MQNIAVKSVVLLFDLDETPQAAQLPAGVMVLPPKQSDVVLPILLTMLGQADQVVPETTLASPLLPAKHGSDDAFAAETKSNGAPQEYPEFFVRDQVTDPR